MEDTPIKQFTNLDLVNKSESDFSKSITNDFINDNFIDNVEWAMLLVQQRMKQMFLSESMKEVYMSSFNKAYLMGGGIDEVNSDLIFYKGLDDMQATPQMFPLLNMRLMIIDDTINLIKVKELDKIEKRNLWLKKRYAYDYSLAFYMKDKESWYASREGYEVNDEFFKLLISDNLTLKNLPTPISLKRGYYTKENITWYNKEIIAQIITHLNMAYQVALTMFYEWSLCIKEKDSISIIIPIKPSILHEIYNTSMLKFDDRKRMLHFVREHYRRKPTSDNNDYSVFVQKYLRGEYKFDYRGFFAEIIPPKYDLNRIKTKKTFIDPYK